MTATTLRRLATVLALLVAALATVAAAQGTTRAVTATQLKTGFKRATGQKLVVDRQRTSPGHYTAFNLGVPNKTKQDRYGTFTVYLVTASDVAAEVERLLMDPHTGQVGTPVGGLYWERGTSMHGDTLWTAKRKYGENVVLWWTGSESARKTDRTYATLHRALKAITGRSQGK